VIRLNCQKQTVTKGGRKRLCTVPA
jgi:hypothetical protein